MPTQTATTGNLENAQNIVLAQCRYTAEHNAPCVNLIEHFTLGKGEKQLTVPKVGSMTANDLTDGIDIVSSEDIGLTTTDLTASEVGLKVILTDKLLRQFNEDVLRVVGRQMGDAMARKENRDIIALFSALNGGTTLGSDGASLGLGQAAACVTFAAANKFPTPIAVVHHPNAIGYLSQNAVGIGTSYYNGIMSGYREELLRNFWRINVNGANFFQTGDIDKIATVDSAYGAILSKAAMCIITAKSPSTERERDASLRAWELVMVADYGVFELDDTYGAPMRYEIGTLTTT